MKTNIENKNVLYIIIPAYNEEINIGQCIRDWYPIVEKYSGGGVTVSYN